MAEKPAVSKSQAIRDYLKLHPNAMPVAVAEALTKDDIKVTPGHVSAVKFNLNKAKAAKPAAAKATPAIVEKAAKPAAKAVAAPVAVQPPAPPKANGTITLEQVKMVAQTIKAMGGFQQMTEVLEVIKEAGGVKKFKDLAEAMACPEPVKKLGPDDIVF